MSIDKVLQEILGQIKEDLEKQEDQVKVEVGTVSEETRQAFLDFKRLEREIKDDLELRIEQMERKMKRDIEREFEERADQAEQKHKEIWATVTAELNIDPNGHYSINRKTGIVSEKINKIKSPFSRH